MSKITTTKLISVTLLVSFMTIAVVLAKGVSVYAQSSTPGSGQALEIGPPLISLTANPGDTLQADINLRDVSSGNLLVTSQVNDFIANGEDGTPKVVLEDEANPYSLKTWISAIEPLTLKSKELKKLTVTINIPGNASPGGYYGVVRFTGTAPELQDTGVSLSASLGALIFIRINGDAQENMSIEEFSVNKDSSDGPLFESTPISFVERVKNNGNVYEQPSGKITITDMFGKDVATINVNLPPGNVLPASIRKFEQTLDSSTLGNKIMFGYYKAHLKVSYGDSNQEVSSDLTFWVIPYRLITVIVVGLLLAFFVLRLVIKRYNRHIISKAQKHSTKK
jgi:hypothetical protein